MLKLHLKTSQPPSANDASPVQTPGSARPRIKLHNSQPPTPAIEQPQSHITASESKPPRGKKRAAGDIASPAAKRVASDASRRTSLNLKVGEARTSLSAGRLKLNKRKSTGPKLARINVKGRIPDREPGNAYDSEDSDRERDPAIEQHVVLRMQPGEDCDLLRKAIAERTIGMTAPEGGIEVIFKFLDRELRRALITIRGHMYAAVLVDLPCIVETMKSWDKRGWWKVADISQMLLVLGRVQTEEQARTHALPERILNEKTWAYAHGLTPPMHWVRKRRFRKRLSFKDNANVEDEVAKLIADDAVAEVDGGTVNWHVSSRDSLERSVEPEADDALDTIENDDYEEEEHEDMDAEAAEAELQALFDMEHAEEPMQTIITSGITSNAVVDSPIAMTAPVAEDRSSGTPAETPVAIQTPAADDQDDDDEDEEESSGDDDDDDDIDAYDEDAQAAAAEKNMQRQEVQDLANEVRLQREKEAGITNQLLLKRQREKLKSLEEELATKRRVYGLDDEDEED